MVSSKIKKIFFFTIVVFIIICIKSFKKNDLIIFESFTGDIRIKGQYLNNKIDGFWYAINISNDTIEYSKWDQNIIQFYKLTLKNQYEICQRINDSTLLVFRLDKLTNDTVLCFNLKVKSNILVKNNEILNFDFRGRLASVEAFDSINDILTKVFLFKNSMIENCYIIVNDKKCICDKSTIDKIYESLYEIPLTFPGPSPKTNAKN